MLSFKNLFLSKISLQLFLPLNLLKRHFLLLPLLSLFEPYLLLQLSFSPLGSLFPLPLLQGHLVLKVDASFDPFLLRRFKLIQLLHLGFSELLLSPVKF